MKKMSVCIFLLVSMIMMPLGMAFADQGQTEIANQARVAFMQEINPSLSEESANNMLTSYTNAASENDVDIDLLLAITWIESNFDPANVTGRCIGLMQIHVNTGKAYGYSMSDLYNSDSNIEMGTLYIKAQMDTYGGDVNKALSAYNQGPVRVSNGNYSTWYQEKVNERLIRIKEYIANY